MIDITEMPSELETLEGENHIMRGWLQILSKALLMHDASEANECKFDDELHERALELAEAIYNYEDDEVESE